MRNDAYCVSGKISLGACPNILKCKNVSQKAYDDENIGIFAEENFRDIAWQYEELFSAPKISHKGFKGHLPLKRT